ncbi:hypothetical protein [Arenibaculum pallidiluteum]|uniref:hypothetical protein n=1 Tax=Arenibaculum pallidiluteum TaxID=2812559 RepID=UPI001A957A6E|nr:hypothetical protein [Arenibaculum pallidiluteum]
MVTTSKDSADRMKLIGALAEFYPALVCGDLALIDANWGSARVQVDLRQRVIHRYGDGLAAAWQETGPAAVSGWAVELRIRTGRLFRRIAEWWRRGYHLGSFGALERLERYQAAVLGSSAHG